MKWSLYGFFFHGSIRILRNLVSKLSGTAWEDLKAVRVGWLYLQRPELTEFRPVFQDLLGFGSQLIWGSECHWSTGSGCLAILTLPGQRTSGDASHGSLPRCLGFKKLLGHDQRSSWKERWGCPSTEPTWWSRLEMMIEAPARNRLKCFP